MKNKFFVADLHLNHSNICKGTSTWTDTSKCRDFENLADMNVAIIEGINNKVGTYDDLYIVGDFCFGGHKYTPDWRRLINCKNIHIIRGNHDTHIHKYSNVFTSVNSFLNIEDKGVLITMCHFPLYTWEDMHKGSYMIHGHEHGNINEDNRGIRRLDVGIDSAYQMFGRYEPFSMEEVHDLLGNMPLAEKGHHKIITK